MVLGHLPRKYYNIQAVRIYFIMSHCHHDHSHESMGDRALSLSIAINVLLTFAQIAGGIFSGSLSLIADALHNLSDAGSLCIAYYARKVARKPLSESKSFGYQKAEVIATLINLVLLVVVGAYLLLEAFQRWLFPEPIAGWIVVVVAGVALLIDLATAALTYRHAKESMNMRAAFIHNLTDALASVAVIVAGTLIILFDWYWVDTLLTVSLSLYILWQGLSMLPESIHILMDGTPRQISVEEVKNVLEKNNLVLNVHHLHIRHLGEHKYALEAHVVLSESTLDKIELIKKELKTTLQQKFKITHSTLEIETSGATCDNNCDPHNSHCSSE